MSNGLFLFLSLATYIIKRLREMRKIIPADTFVISTLLRVFINTQVGAAHNLTTII